MTNVMILDYGSGNLRSAERALAATGAEVTVSTDLALAASADGLVVPGVGAYAACMAGIETSKAGPMISDRLAEDRPVLGICVGAQIMFTMGNEHGHVTKGLGFLPGDVTRLAAKRIPHMGWNLINAPATSVLFAGIREDARCYFVHSYAATSSPQLEQCAIVTTSTHEQATFVAAVEAGPLTVTQFHPEKSGIVGAQLLKNWVQTLPAH